MEWHLFSDTGYVSVRLKHQGRHSDSLTEVPREAERHRNIISLKLAHLNAKKSENTTLLRIE